MDSNYDLVKEGHYFFFGDGSIQDGILLIIQALLILFNAIIFVRIVYLFIERAHGDENGQITKLIINCIKAAVIVNVLGSISFISQIVQSYFEISM